MNLTKVGNYICELRKSHNWTQSELASRLNVSDKAVSKWESGNGLPDISILPALAKVLAVTVDELLDGKSKKSVINESIYGKIASGDLDLIEEIEKGLKYDVLDEYGKSLADYCVEKNNITVLRLLFKLNKLYITHKRETRTNANIQPGGKETFVYEEVMICDRAYFIGKDDYLYQKNYSDSALFCLVVKNRADDLLQQLKIDVREFNDAEAESIADDFDYFYKNYFIRTFPTYIGKIIGALVKKGYHKEAIKCFELIETHKQNMQQKYDKYIKDNSNWTNNNWELVWDTETESILEKDKGRIFMRNKIMAYLFNISIMAFWNGCENRRIIGKNVMGNAVVITQRDVVEIGFANPEFLAMFRKLDITPIIDVQLLNSLLDKDDITVFEAFMTGQVLNDELEKLIINSDAKKIKAHYFKSNKPKNINDAIATGDVDFVLFMLSTPKAILQYSNNIDFSLLGSKQMLPVLRKFIPFFGKDTIDKLLNDIVPQDNIEARIALIEAGAKVLVYNDYLGTYRQDDLQTEILYKLLKKEL